MVSLLPLWSVCLFFSCLIALARISKRVLNRSGESRHPYFVSYLSGKVLSRFTVKYDFVGFPWMPFQRLRKFPSTCLLTVFHMKICCILSNAYSVSIQSCDSFSFVLFNMAFYTDSFFRCSMNLTLRDKSHLLIVCNPFKKSCCWIWFASILISIFIRDTGLLYSFILVSLLSFGTKILLTSWNEVVNDPIYFLEEYVKSL